MRNDQFDDLYMKISKIIEIVDRIPVEAMREDVFRKLYETAIGQSEDESLTDVILKITENGQLLKDFVISKNPQSNIERTLLFVYFLNKNGISAITMKHIAACYEICEIAAPKNLQQNLRDNCSARYQYLQNVQNNYYVTPKGMDFCEN